jgi:hypothetical protein
MLDCTQRWGYAVVVGRVVVTSSEIRAFQRLHWVGRERATALVRDDTGSRGQHCGENLKFSWNAENRFADSTLEVNEG